MVKLCQFAGLKATLPTIAYPESYSGILHQLANSTIYSGAINRAKSDLALARLASCLVIRSRGCRFAPSLRSPLTSAPSNRVSPAGLCVVELLTTT